MEEEWSKKNVRWIFRPNFIVGTPKLHCIAKLLVRTFRSKCSQCYSGNETGVTFLTSYFRI